MEQATHNKIVSFIWGIADDVLRDLFKRGKYPDVILPMCVLRRLDAVLEPAKRAVLDTKAMLDQAGITEQEAALCDAAGQAFYNTSPFTLRDLKARGSQQQLLADFTDYLNGFSKNVQDILENFKFRNQLPTLSKADALGTLIAKFLDPDINLSPSPVTDGDGTLRQPALDNHAMGTVFEELVRKFNEENNEEAGEHWTPRDAVRLMASLIFLYGLFEGRATSPKASPPVLEYEPDPDLRDTEQIPFSEAPDSGLLGGLPTAATAKQGIEAFFRREVLPYTPDAWLKPDSAKVGYEISFTRHFYKPQPLRSLAEIRADILAVQQESEGLLDSILEGAKA